MAKDQRQVDRDEELARQKAVTDALEAFNKEWSEEAEKRLEDPTRADKQEAARLAEVDKALNASVKAHDKLMKENAK